MFKRGNTEFLSDIKEAAIRIKVYIDKINYEKFLQDIKTQDAVIRNLEIIGEAVKNLSTELKENYKEVEWKKFAGIRDKIIHYYFGVNWDIVWVVIKDRIPELKEKIEKIIKEIEVEEEDTSPDNF